MRSHYKRLILVPAFLFSGCGGHFPGPLSADGELDEEYRLKNVYAQCLKESAKDGIDCSKIKQQVLMQEEWNAMDGGV